LSYPVPQEEKELVEQCLENNRVAQRQLFLKYKDAMYTILLRMLNDQDEATDALQETFIAVFKSLKSYKFESTLGAWVKTIAVRMGIGKQRKRSKLYVEPIDQIADEPVVWPDDMTSEVLESAIARLSDGYRTIFLLIEVEGYTHKETAQMLCISEGTSKSQLYHAKKLLQKFLEGYQYEQ